MGRGKAGRREWPIVARPCLGNSIMKILFNFFFHNMRLFVGGKKTRTYLENDFRKNGGVGAPPSKAAGLTHLPIIPAATPAIT